MLSRPDSPADPSAADQPFDPDRVAEFRYLPVEFDPSSGLLTCRYALDDLEFTELITFDVPAADVDLEAVLPALRLVHLLAGISYYKAAAPPRIVVDGGLTPAERDLLHAFYIDGLGEYAYQNDLDLSGIEIVAEHREPVATHGVGPTHRRLLVPFGGGVDSIVTVDGVRGAAEDTALFVVARRGDLYDAIEAPAAVTGLKILRASRVIDPKVLRSRELGYRNGHVPVTGVISAITVAAALLDGRDTVIMSNEWSASSGNVERNGRLVNHQWSKSLEFEDLFRAALAEALPRPVDYFSWLRATSELWVAKRFAALTEFHSTFRSCNRSFHINPADRLDHWCGVCDKCAFIDLIASPYMGRDALESVFDGNEPWANAAMIEQFRTLVGVSGDIKPFECVGDVDECRVAVVLAAGRADRADCAVLQQVAAEVRPLLPADLSAIEAQLLGLMGPHRVPEVFVPAEFRSDESRS